MATEESTGTGDAYHPLSGPRQVMQSARQNDLVIQCTGATGVTHSYIHFSDGLWVANRVSKWNDNGWVVAPGETDSICNCISRCDPDVRLVEERNSTFGGSDDG
jgi:hypothetical protein